MPKQSGKSSLASKYGSKFNEAKENEISYGSSGDLPAGIEMGVAQLVDCEFAQYKTGDNVGEDYFRAAGVVVHSGNSNTPEEHGGQRIKGLRTQIMEPIMDTPTRSRKTVKDHVDWVINELKKLGVDTDEIDFEEEGQIEAVVESLRDAKPYFRFRTWKGKPQTTGPYAGQEPRTTHEWKGQCEFSNGEMTDDGVEDNTAEEPKKGAKAPAKAAKKADPVETEADEEVDLDALVEAANGGEKDKAAIAARKKLTALATEAGNENVEEIETWEEVAALIRIGDNPPDDDSGVSDDSASSDSKPEEGDVYKFTPLDPKTKKKGKPAEFEVVSVDADDETVTLKDNVTKKMYVDLKKKPIAVGWDKLETPD